MQRAAPAGEPAPSDERLWQLARGGDGEAFARVYDRHVDAVFTHCVRRTGSPADAEDITSMTFLQAWRSADRIRFVGGSARPWLLVVATNLARNLARARRRHAAVLDRLPHEDRVPDVADEAIRDVAAEQFAARLGAAITALRRQEQQVFALVVLAELSYQDAADVLDVPLGTVRSRLARARKKLQSLLVDDTPPAAAVPALPRLQGDLP